MNNTELNYSSSRAGLGGCSILALGIALVAGGGFLSPATAAEQEGESGRQIMGALEEIVVTAQHREERAQDIAVQVTTLTADMIEKTFARDMKDIGGLAPNLIIDPIFGPNTAAISIRGVQLNDGEKSFDPAVAVYLDGVYLATTTGALLHMWDAESVEILRGPQGTMFGRNTIGGLVHVKRARPTGEWGGRAQITYGRFDAFDAKATLNLPSILDDTLDTKVSFIRRTGGGYFENITRNVDEGNTDFTGVTAMAVWRPSNDLTVDLIYEYIDDETPSLPLTSLAADGDLFCNAVPGIGDAGCGRPPSDVDFHRKTRTSLAQNAFLETHAVTLKTSYDINPDHSIEGVFGWRDTDEFAITEWDGVEADLFSTERPQNLEQFSAELRWHGNFLDDRLTSVLGGYFFHSTYSLRQTVISPAFFGGLGPEVVQLPEFDQETDSFAIFGQVDFDVTEQITLTLGGRYLDEQKSACGSSRIVDRATDTTFFGTAFGDCKDPVAPLAETFLDPVTGEIVPVQGKESWTKFTPRIGLTYHFDQGIAFATYSEGFRSGGYNGRATSPDTLGPYDPEKVTSIEAGFKTDWFDNRLQFNVVGFLTDYKNKQEDVVFPDPAGSTVTLVQNAATAEINGVEIEARAIPVSGLTLGGSLGYLDASFNEWTVPGLDGNPVDKSGFELRRAPQWSANFNALYEYQLPNEHFLAFTANVTHRSSYYVNANTVTAAPEPVGRNGATTTLDLSANYETDRWRFSVFGKNITGEDYFLHVLDVGTNFVAAGPNDPTPVPLPGLFTYGTINGPATWGVELQVTF